LSQGSLIQFLDADDLLHPEKLSRQVPLALQHEDSLVFCDAEVIDMDSGQVLGHWARRLSPGMDPVEYVLTSVVQTAAPLHWKRCLVDIGGFREEMPPCEDPDLHLRLACAGVKFHQVPEVLYTSRRTRGSLSETATQRNPAKVRALECKLVTDAMETLQQSGGMTERRARAMAGAVAAVARRCIRDGLLEESRAYFRQAASIHPSGGLHMAYSRLAYILYRTLGPRITESLTGMKRHLTGFRRLR
jgi:hypothetical protein